ncbi:MAG: hypothetical protein Ct9H300mP4_05770 [Gammaproteobacteria bacterium]|nr:MAG: hypothetical protein Ct9H300mP4_05770 [Gammaproteobacteria bacterium]
MDYPLQSALKKEQMVPYRLQSKQLKQPKSHHFLGLKDLGQTTVYRNPKGNDTAMWVLRGGPSQTRRTEYCIV